ncbi:MAG: hypothetical protein WAW39_27275 [Prosthecobacter sp.]|uniref:hypothetical protein n=1 Tax=Prosthecobacter sp. TaxID=1965333 RepID=UPI003BAF0443
MKILNTLLAALAVTSVTQIHAGSPPPQGIAAAASEPAVSAINGKLDANYGAINRASTRGVAGSLSVPLGHRFGAQFDGLYQHGFSTNIYGVGTHFFARDPGKGLIGLASSWTTSQKFTDVIVGMEGEYYFDKVTLGTVVGWNNYDSHVNTTFPGLVDHQNFVAARVYAAIYPMDDLMVRLEYQSRFNHNFYVAHVEWQTPVSGVAVFADAGVGDNNYAHVMGGVRVYFGGSKPLKDRHRKDDPSNMGSTFLSTNSAGSTDVGEAPAGGPPPPPPPPPP